MQRPATVALLWVMSSNRNCAMRNRLLAPFLRSYGMVCVVQERTLSKGPILEKIDRLNLAHHGSLKLVEVDAIRCASESQRNELLMQDFVIPALRVATARGSSVLLIGPGCRFPKALRDWDRNVSDVVVGTAGLWPLSGFRAARIEFCGLGSGVAKALLHLFEARKERSSPHEPSEDTGHVPPTGSDAHLSVLRRRATLRRGSFISERFLADQVLSPLIRAP